MPYKKRGWYPGISLLKVLAEFFVFAVHGLHSSWLLKGAHTPHQIFGVGFLYSLFCSTIPLFILISGFLSANKREAEGFDRQPYLAAPPSSGLRSLLFSYGLAVTLDLLFRHFYEGEALSPLAVFAAFLNGRVNGITWPWFWIYYFILYFCMPFLDYLLSALKEDKKARQLFLWLGFFLVLLPPFFNPLMEQYLEGKLGLVESLSAVYFMFYYCLGYLLYYHRPAINKGWYLLTLLLVCLVQARLFFSLQPFPRENWWTFYGGYASLPHALAGLCLFLIFCDISLPARLDRRLSYLSSLTLDAYLVGHLFDRLIYPPFRDRVVNFRSRFLLLIFPVLLSLVFSFSYAALKKKLVQAVKGRRKSRQAEK